MNHGTERTSRVLAESLRFEVEQGRAEAPSWFPLVPSSTRSKFRELPGEGKGEGWGE